MPHSGCRLGTETEDRTDPRMSVSTDQCHRVRSHPAMRWMSSCRGSASRRHSRRPGSPGQHWDRLVVAAGWGSLAARRSGRRRLWRYPSDPAARPGSSPESLYTQCHWHVLLPVPGLVALVPGLLAAEPVSGLTAMKSRRFPLTAHRCQRRCNALADRPSWYRPRVADAVLAQGLMVCCMLPVRRRLLRQPQRRQPRISI